MTSLLPEGHINSHLPFVKALEELVGDEHGPPDGATPTLTSPATVAVKHSWFHKIIPGMEHLAVREKLANNVAVARGPNPPVQFESMPIYVRLGMHLLYCGRAQEKLLGSSSVEKYLKEQSIATGKKYDSTVAPLPHILEFIKTYSIDLTDLAEPDPAKYKCFNEFFSRALKEGARPIDDPEREDVVSSAADCRLTVFATIALAQEFWIKGKKFTIPALLEDETTANQFVGGSIAICRLAPADYHRYHAPLSGTIGALKEIEGAYYTVNPAAINEDLNVYTKNRRNIVLLAHDRKNDTPLNIACINVGAMLVGSIIETVKQGDQVKRGDCTGYFQYGGSTVLVLFPPGAVKWDEDLVVNSKKGLETAVRVGERIGVLV